MNEEQIKKMIADDFDNLIKERLDSAIIFKYISNLEKENLKLKEQYCERTDCSGRLGNSKKVEELEKEVEKLQHYKTLYQSLKRQKDIEIEQLESSIGIVKHNMIIQKHVDIERKLKNR